MQANQGHNCGLQYHLTALTVYVHIIHNCVGKNGSVYYGAEMSILMLFVDDLTFMAKHT